VGNADQAGDTHVAEGARKAGEDTPTSNRFSDKMERFFRSSFGSAVLTLLVTTVLGTSIAGAISYEFTEVEKERADRIERLDNTTKNRDDLLKAFSDTFTARRVYVSLVVSAIRHHVPLDELKARWVEYQKAYLEYNMYAPKYRAALLKFLGARTYVVYAGASGPMDRDLTRSFGRIDTCLTDAYYLEVRGNAKAAFATLGSCRVKRGIPKGATATTWDIQDQNDSLNKCLDSYEIEAMFSVYLEENFDHLPATEQISDAERRPWWDFLGTAKIPLGNKCARDADWTCQRRISRAAIAKKLASACAELDDANYYTFSTTVPISKPAAILSTKKT
jgi:hypothetical protein